ncbi:MAG: pyruvate kinase [Planctomycetaceae bacterium]|nr:pyruvate kinase [Planctomycetaceae bacterium]
MAELLSGLTPVRRASHTKIVATVGPVSDSPEMLVRMIRAGVDVFRINTAHGSAEDHARRLAAIRKASDDIGHPVAVLVDLEGPKMRLGELPGGVLECNAGDALTFVRGEHSDQPGQLTCTYEALIDELTIGDRILMADGAVALQVEQVDQDFAACRVRQAGRIKSRQGINLPGVKLHAAALSDSDRPSAEWAATAGVDFLGLSFVRRADDVVELRRLIEKAGGETQIVAKIEKPEALENLDAIIAATDAVMVARGDLGVEIDIARIAVVQKEIVAACRRAHKPVIIATQMLESMHHASLPTRAEATDVANAILDGADACMLSGETAVGDHPLEVVKMMHRVAVATEPLAGSFGTLPRGAVPLPQAPNITGAVTYAAALIAEQLKARLIAVATVTGRSALEVSQQRTDVPIIGVSTSPAILRRMALYWGVIPLAGAPVDDEGLLEFLMSRGGRNRDIRIGDRIVMVAGTRGSDGRHNAVIVHEVR